MMYLPAPSSRNMLSKYAQCQWLKISFSANELSYNFGTYRAEKFEVVWKEWCPIPGNFSQM